MFLPNASGVGRATHHRDAHHHSLAAQSSNGEGLSVLSRRHLLRTTIAGAAAGVLAGGGIEFSAPRPALAQSVLSPEKALQALMDGNKRFVERRLTFYKEDLAILKQNTA